MKQNTAIKTLNNSKTSDTFEKTDIHTYTYIYIVL